MTLSRTVAAAQEPALRLVLATANPHKASEIRSMLDPVVGLLLLPRPPEVPEVAETGTTLEENARLKARALLAATGPAAVADDTGLEVDALGGEPGVYSARYAGEGATYADNVAKLLGALEVAGAGAALAAPGAGGAAGAGGAVAPPAAAGVGRTARFRTVAIVAFPDGSEVVAEGSVEGIIAGRPRGEGGFG
ncbi:MAG: non-canonical purine NTP pyrophosphatase, partial [Acidimicrobiales bacterium]